MKAMIMAAGLGTRLRPWTLEHPKALVPVDGVPVLEHLILKLKSEGFRHIVVNVHHFAGQVLDFLDSRDFGIRINVSDESSELLDTGGALAKASEILLCDRQPVLVHNVDILSNASLGTLMAHHDASGNDITLLTSDRESSRKLLFDNDGILRGWHRVGTDQYKPEGFFPTADCREEAFSGIYLLGPEALEDICRYGRAIGKDAFPIMDYFMSMPENIKIRRHHNDSLRILDIGKPDALKRAADLLKFSNERC